MSVKDRRLLFRTYPACFVGEQLVDWLLAKANNTSSPLPRFPQQLRCYLPSPPHTRADAVQIGRAMLERGVLYHVVKDHHFKDEGLFYRFKDGPLPYLTPVRRSLSAESVSVTAPVFTAAGTSHRQHTHCSTTRDSVCGIL